MPAKRYRVVLTEKERCSLKELVSKGKAAANKLLHARILLKADESGDGLLDQAIVEALDVSLPTVERVRKTFVEDGIEAAVNRKKREYGPNPKKLDGEKEAHLVALACSKAPEGRAIWTLRLLAEKLVELDICDEISTETIRQTLKKMKLSLG